MRIIAMRGTFVRAPSGVFALAAAVLAAVGSARAGTYTFASLGLSDSGNNLAIANGGEVVGTSGGQAVYSTGGSALAVLGGASAPADSTALGVNSGGVVVGQYLPTGGSQVQAFYTPTSSPSSTLTPLPTTYGGAGGGAMTNIANAVNGTSSTYEAVGQATYSGGEVRAFAWTKGSATLTPIDPVSGSGAPTNTGLGGGLFGSSAAYGLNASGLIVGQASSSGTDNPLHAFLYVPANSKMYDLGSLGNTTLGEGDSNALAISASGEIVGWTDDVIAGNDYDPRAFVIKSGYTIPAATGSADESLFTGPTGMVDIGVLAGDSYSEALSVNSSGIVVGWSGQDSAGDSAHAFIYDSSAGTPVMEDLNDYVTGLPAGWTLDWASGVNDAGQITGYADDGEGDTYGFLLTPSAAVPEPGLGMVVLAGAALVSLRRRRA